MTHKKEKKIFKKQPVLVPKITFQNKWVAWRASESKKLNSQKKLIFKKLVLSSFVSDQDLPEEMRSRFFHLSSTVNKNSAFSKPKNYCFFIGRSRSVNKSLYMSRHMIRKFARFGMVQGLVKDRC